MAIRKLSKSPNNLIFLEHLKQKKKKKKIYANYAQVFRTEKNT